MQLMAVVIILFRLFSPMDAQNCTIQEEKNHGQMFICTMLHQSQIESYLTPFVTKVKHVLFQNL